MTTASSNTFELLQRNHIASLNLVCEEYQHKATAARHIHLSADNSENVFLVALRTVPTDSTGVAHILEHTSLCGSEKYPVRDPFFMMIRRSLNTFMNAFTSSDWTAYPFASQNRKDFDNLLEVYLDAVFFARLDPLDFAQEGHRLEFEDSANPDSPLTYKGVVFNEMKGAMSSISSQLWQAVGEQLFPDTTYGVNSGGEPADIPNLSYEQLQAFYKTHYHPDNAIFFTYGDIPAYEQQQKFEALALNRFTEGDQTISVPLQPRFTRPLRASKPYPADTATGIERQNHLVMGWLLDDIRCTETVFALHLLSSALLENSASPLQMALEKTELGSAPSPLCGLEDSGLELVFVCGLEGAAANIEDAFESLVIGCLNDVAENGIDSKILEALLDQLELQQREISGDSYPYGLQIILSCMPAAIHRADPANTLDIDPILQQLREKIHDPDFIKNLVRDKLLDNPHRVTVTLTPDEQLAAQRATEERSVLDSIKHQLTEQQRQQILDTTAALEKRQAQQDDPEILPKVTLNDVPADIPVPTSVEAKINSYSSTFYAQGTNGLVYQQIIAELPDLNAKQLGELSMHNRLLTELGVGKLDYLTTQQWQSQVCGGINAFSSMRGALDNEQQVTGYFVLSGKGLATRNDDIAQLLQQTYSQPRFDEYDRLRELVAQSRARAEQSITGNGHGLAMAIASQSLSPTARLNHQSSGILGIQRLKTLDDSLSDSDALAGFAEQLANLHQRLTHNTPRFLFVGEKEQQENMQRALVDNWPELTQSNSGSKLNMESCREQSRQLWVCNSQVNFCAKAYPTVTASHADAPALTVLGGVLRNGFLHTAIREQGGAYGAGASQDSGVAAFRFYSYRDPRLADTLDDFDRSIQWLLDQPLEWRQVEEAILGVISSIDKPASPAGTAKQHFHNLLFGRTPEQQMAFRQAVLEVKQADLQRVAEHYLRPEQASIGIVSHSGESDHYTPLCEQQSIKIIEF